MKLSFRGIFKFVAVMAVFFLLIRFFPIVIQMIEAAALGIRSFWFAILVIALIGWLVWSLSNRDKKP